MSDDLNIVELVRDSQLRALNTLNEVMAAEAPPVPPEAMAGYAQLQAVRSNAAQFVFDRAGEIFAGYQGGGEQFVPEPEPQQTTDWIQLDQLSDDDLRGLGFNDQQLNEVRSMAAAAKVAANAGGGSLHTVQPEPSRDPLVGGPGVVPPLGGAG